MKLLRPKDLAELWLCSERHIYYLMADPRPDRRLNWVNIARPGAKRTKKRIPLEAAEEYARTHGLKLPDTQ